MSHHHRDHRTEASAGGSSASTPPPLSTRATTAHGSSNGDPHNPSQQHDVQHISLQHGVSSSSNNLMAPEEADPMHLLRRTPTAEEIATTASPAYVLSLLQIIEGHQEATAHLLEEIEQLRSTREARYRQVCAARRTETENTTVLQERCAALTLQLQEERERSARLLHENSVLLTRAAEDRDRVQALRALAEQRHGSQLPPHTPKNKVASSTGSAAGAPAVTSTSTAFGSKGVVSTMSLRQATSSLSASSPHYCAAPPQEKQTKEGAYRGYAEEEDVEVLRALQTSPVATATHVAALTEEVHMLRVQLDAQRAVYEQERGVRLQDTRDAERAHQEAVHHFQERINELEALHEAALSDLVTYRHRTGRALRDTRGHVDWLTRSLHDALRMAESARKHQHAIKDRVSHHAESHYGPMVRTLHKELGQRQHLMQSERQAMREQIIEKENKIEDLGKELQRAQSRLQRAVERHRLESDGMHSELALMRRSVRQLEKKVYFSRLREEAAREEERNITSCYFFPPET